MNKTRMLLCAALCTAGAAQAGSYGVQQESDCPLLGRAELAQAIQQAAAITGLSLPRDMTLRAELRCSKAANGKSPTPQYVYTFRATIERLLQDGEGQRWATVAQHTGYGMTTTSPRLLREVKFTLRDLIRQEP